MKATTRRAKLGRSRRATNFERSLCPGPSPCSLRSSCLTAYRRWLDRAGTFTNMTLSVLGGPCCDSHAVAYFCVKKPYLCVVELRPNAGRARIAQQRPNRRKFVHACFVDTPYVAGS